MLAHSWKRGSTPPLIFSCLHDLNCLFKWTPETEEILCAQHTLQIVFLSGEVHSATSSVWSVCLLNCMVSFTLKFDCSSHLY